MRLGSIILYKNINAVTAWVQRFVLSTLYSHSAVYSGQSEAGYMEEWEANLQVGTTRFKPLPENQMEIYTLQNVPIDIVKQALDEVSDELDERGYGYIQWLTIFIRRIYEWLLPERFHYRVKARRILWGWGIICTEAVWRFLHRVFSLVVIRSRDIATVDRGLSIKYALEKYNKDTFHNVDLAEIMNYHTFFFKKDYGDDSVAPNTYSGVAITFFSLLTLLAGALFIIIKVLF